MIDILTQQAQWTEYERILNEAFPVNPGCSFFDDFPVWNPALSVPSRITAGVVREGRVVAGASARVATLRTESGPQSVTIIGGVCCDKQFRGQGYASRLVEVLLDWSNAQRSSGELLWSSEAAMYERLGFSSYGTQVRYLLGSRSQAQLADGQIREGWSESLWSAIQKNRSRGLVLSHLDRSWFEAHKNTHWCRLERDGVTVAYAALGRGIDLPQMIHEWGGHPADVRRLMDHLAKVYPDLTVLGSAEDGAELGLEEQLRESLCLLRGGDRLGKFWIWGLDAG